MYVTAQRVRSQSKEGVNAFLSLHRDDAEAARIDWEQPAVQSVAEQNPGILVDNECDVAPGGNRVRSFLDVVAADGTEAARILAALDAFEGELDRAELPYTKHLDRVGIRFHVEPRLEQERLDEYRVLKNRISRLLARRGEPQSA